MDGARIPASRIYITPAMMQATAVMIRQVLMTLALSSEGKKRMMEVSKPRLEKRMTSPRDDISAVAKPTCSIVYSRAAIIQKRKPQPTLKMLVKAMKKEFLYRGSLTNREITL
jgi:hypothetical protein